MRRGLVHTIAWLLATGAATTLTWWGVHTVMAGTAYDPPRALPLPVDGAQEVSAASRAPLDSSTRRPRSPSAKPPTPSPTAPSPSPETPEGGRTASPSAPAGTEPDASREPSASPGPGSGSGSGSGSEGTVESYAVDGGRVVLELGSSSAELVSATPNAGWQVQAWSEEYWIRVTFTRDGREVSVFCTWHDHPPKVEFDDR
ncbi:hypothetical protein ACIBJC_18745 [Streptomyces sp. NPDC050509]|uniref:hypothetical protein n=1 Tax=Streptomyces sp. NPDC050509 TaxID=3365620 RepID=UPI00378CC715